MEVYDRCEYFDYLTTIHVRLGKPCLMKSVKETLVLIKIKKSDLTLWIPSLRVIPPVQPQDYSTWRITYRMNPMGLLIFKKQRSPWCTRKTLIWRTHMSMIVLWRTQGFPKVQSNLIHRSQHDTDLITKISCLCSFFSVPKDSIWKHHLP